MPVGTLDVHVYMLAGMLGFLAYGLFHCGI